MQIVKVMIVSGQYSNCLEVKRSLGDEKYTVGVHEISMGSNKTKVQCDPEGWTVIQSRGQFGNPQDYFNRGWDDYVRGFGIAGRETRAL